MKSGIRQFSRGQIDELDRRLNYFYDNPVPREDYFGFIWWLERLISINHTHYECQFENNKERVYWGRKLDNGKMRWKLDMIIDNLVRTNVIYRSSYHFGDKNSHTRTYQFTVDFRAAIRSSELGIAAVNETVIDKINVLKVDSENPQYKMLMSERFKLDADSSMNVIEGLDSYNEAIYKRTISDMLNKSIYLSVSDTTGRLTSSFTNIKREVRKFCTIDNEHLSSLDLQSSQAYLLANVIMDDNEETKRFYDMIIEGRLYDYLGKKLGTDIEDTKDHFYHYLYKGNCGAHIPVQKIIINEWPHINKLVMQLNRELKASGQKLCNVMQQLEASIFVPVANRHALEGCLSVHDSIYFKESLRPIITQELDDAFARLGLTNYTLR